MPGRALEVSLATADIRRSFEFWSQLGFGSALTSDIWSHPYGVMTAPSLNLGLHGAQFVSPLVCLVRPDIAGLVPLLEERGVEPEALRVGGESFNEVQFSDPSGLRIRVLEARTFSPPGPQAAVLPGRFDGLSWPAAEPEAVAEFWARLHVDCEPRPEDWALLRADIGGQAVTWHSPRLSLEPLLVFRHPDPARLRETLAERSVPVSPRALGFGGPHLSLASPEGIRLAILA